MKKFLFFILVLISINTYAQSLKIGFTSGVSIANYKSKVDGNNESGNAKAGFTAGVFADIPLGKHFSFQPALNFLQKGTRDEQTNGGITEKSMITVNSIEAPLNFLYNTRGKTGNFFIGAGPSFAIAVGGKWTYDDGTIKMSDKLKFGSGDNDAMKAFDIGANFITGFSLNNGMMISVNYNAGLNNLFPRGSDVGTLKSNYFGIKLGYQLKFTKKNK